MRAAGVAITVKWTERQIGRFNRFPKYRVYSQSRALSWRLRDVPITPQRKPCPPQTATPTSPPQPLRAAHLLSLWICLSWTLTTMNRGGHVFVCICVCRAYSQDGKRWVLWEQSFTFSGATDMCYSLFIIIITVIVIAACACVCTSLTAGDAGTFPWPFGEKAIPLLIFEQSIFVVSLFMGFLC